MAFAFNYGTASNPVYQPTARPMQRRTGLPRPPGYPNDWPVPSGGQAAGFAPQGIAGGAGTDPNTGVVPPDYSQGGYTTEPDAFDPSKVPSGVPVEWAKDFINRNPGDYDRLASAYGSGGSSQPNQTPTQAWNAQPSDPRSDAFFDLLMQRIGQGVNVDRMDPSIRNQVDPLVAQMERSSRNYLDQQAEAAGPIANLRGERRLAAERTGQAAGQLESEVIGRERDARRQEIAQALQLYGSRLSDTERNSLERELAYLSNDTARRGQDIGLDEFLRELALRQWQAQDNSAYQWGSLGG